MVGTWPVMPPSTMASTQVVAQKMLVGDSQVVQWLRVLRNLVGRAAIVHGGHRVRHN